MADVASYFVPFDLDSGAGTQSILGMSPRGKASGGSLPIFEDPVALVDNTVNPTVGGVAVFGMVFDGATWDRMPGDAALGVLVNSELPAAAVLSDTLANPTAPAVGSHLMGFDRVGGDWTRIDGLIDGQVVNAATAGFAMFGTDGTNYQLLATDAAGNLQVDVLTGGGSDTPINPVNTTVTSAAVAVAVDTDLDTPEAANKKLAWIDIYATVAWKGEVFTVDNAVESARKGVTGGPAHTAVQFRPTHRDYIKLGATGLLDAFRLKVRNLDDNLPADFHAVFHYEE